MKSITPLSKEEANRQLAEMLEATKKSLLDCQSFADYHGLSFTFNHPDSIFQDTYKGREAIREEIANDSYYTKYPEDVEEHLDYAKGWQSSSIRC